MFFPGGHWKIISTSNICPFQDVIQDDTQSHLEFISVEKTAAQKIINLEHSQVLHDPDIPIQTLGMMLLELFLMSPVLSNKGYDELIDDLKKGTLANFVNNEEDQSIFEILKHILIQFRHEIDEQNMLIKHIQVLINQWNIKDQHTPNDIKKNFGKYINKAGAF